MADAETLAAYARKVADYEGLTFSQTENRALTDFLARLAPASRVLDLGCGPGLQALRMQEAGHTVTALDATPEFVEAARARGLDARLGTFDDVTETAAFDAVWASFSLLHAPRADLPRHLAAIRRALVPGGVLLLGMKLGAGEHRDPLGRFYAYHSEAELRAHLENAGFEIDSTRTGEGKGLAGTTDPFIVIFAHA